MFLTHNTIYCIFETQHNILETTQNYRNTTQNHSDMGNHIQALKEIMSINYATTNIFSHILN